MKLQFRHKNIFVHKFNSNIILGLFLFNFLISKMASAQTASQYQADYNISSVINESLSWSSTFGAITTAPHLWSRIYIDPSVQYKWPRMILKNLKFKEKVIGGLALYYTNNVNLPNQLEIRPYQGYQLLTPHWEHLSITHTFKLEERFEINMDNWSNTFGLRLKYQGVVTLRFNGEFWKKGKGFYIPANIELYANLIGVNQFNDKANLDIGLGREFNLKWKALITYGYNYSRAGVHDSFDTGGSRLRIRVYHKL